MAIRNIVKEGDPILNKVCRPVTTFEDRLATLLDNVDESQKFATSPLYSTSYSACLLYTSRCV